jgi:ketol-acid reductoisomerase
MCAPKCPGSEVREEYKEVLSTYFNRCTSENDPNGDGFEQAKAPAAHWRSKLLNSVRCRGKIRFNGRTNYSFAECCKRLYFIDKMVEEGTFLCFKVEYGWETVTEALKHGELRI